MRRVLADGTVREYTYIRKPKRRKGLPYAPDAVARVIDQWQKSPEWKRLAPNTVKRYERGLRWLDEYRRLPIRDLRRKDMLALRDGIAHEIGNGAANSFVDTVSAFFTFALDREHIESHPMLRVKRLPMGEWRRWPEEAVDFALRAFPAHLARAVTLALYTGQRSGDCVKMLWADFDGEGIAVRQQKTGKKLWIACHADLKAAIDTWPRTAVTILTDARGRPWEVKTFQHRTSQEIRRHVELRGLQFHGLRKSAAARLAEAGCTIQEIAAVTGHQSIQMIQHYTKDADQRRLASAAILKLQNAKRRNDG